MATPTLTLPSILKNTVSHDIERLIRERLDSPTLADLSDPDRALRYMASAVRGSYLFTRYAVPLYAGAVFNTLPAFPSVDDSLGHILSDITDLVRGELCNNNIFERSGECHSHYCDLLEAYAAAGGDMQVVAEACADGGSDHPFWSEKWQLYARRMSLVCEEPLSLFILMPSNEDFAPRLFAKVLETLCPDPRFDKYRTFLQKHVQFDSDEHGPSALRWLARYLEAAKPSAAVLERATEKVALLYR